MDDRPPPGMNRVLPEPPVDHSPEPVDLPSPTGTPQYAQEDFATFAPRLGAFVLDWMVVGVLGGIAVRGMGLPPILTIPLAVAYMISFPPLFGTTPGCRAVGIKLVSVDGKNPTPMQILIRTLTQQVSMWAFGSGFLGILSDPKRQTWHDRAAGILVIGEDAVPDSWNPKPVGETIKSGIAYPLAVLGVVVMLLPYFSSRLIHTVLRAGVGDPHEAGAPGIDDVAEEPPAPDEGAREKKTDERLLDRVEPELLQPTETAEEKTRAEVRAAFDAMVTALKGCKDAACYRTKTGALASSGRRKRDRSVSDYTRESEMKLIRLVLEKAAPDGTEIALLRDDNQEFGIVTVRVQPPPENGKAKPSVDIATYFMRESNQWRLDTGPFERPVRTR